MSRPLLHIHLNIHLRIRKELALRPLLERISAIARAKEQIPLRRRQQHLPLKSRRHSLIRKCRHKVYGRIRLRDREGVFCGCDVVVFSTEEGFCESVLIAEGDPRVVERGRELRFRTRRQRADYPGRED